MYQRHVSGHSSQAGFQASCIVSVTGSVKYRKIYAVFGLVLCLGFYMFITSSGLMAQNQKKRALDKIASRQDVQVSDPHMALKPASDNRIADQDASSRDSLQKFHMALHELQSGKRRSPVTILHMGDDHIARDRFSGDLRDLLQMRFGDAGRGMVMPGPVFPFYRANHIHLKSMGNWVVKSGLTSRDAIYGLTGMAYTSSDPKAHIELSSGTDKSFSFVELVVLSGPEQGKARFVIRKKEGVQEQLIDTADTHLNIQRIRYEGDALAVSWHPLGGKPVTVLSWESGYFSPGVRYINLGLPGATIDIAHNMNAAFVKSDLENLKPDLIILGYGSVESQKDELDLSDYRERFASFVQALRKMAPQASVVVIGPPDLSVMPAFTQNVTESHACKALNSEEIKNYSTLVRNYDESLSRWYPPVKLEPVRQILRDVALQENAYFWDWSKVMGGACGIHAWVHAMPKLAAADHKSLTPEGAKVSARAFYTGLMSAFEASRSVVSH